LFGPLNADRFKSGLVRQKAGGMLWKAWLNLETALVDRYQAYLAAFREYEIELQELKRALEEARQSWIDDKIEQKFKRSKAFKRCYEDVS
jgi:hypothetical protein